MPLPDLFVDRQGYAPDYRFENIGEAEESEVGEVDAVDSRFVVGADDVVVGKVVQIAVFGGEFFIAFLHHAVAGIYLIAGCLVKTHVREIRVFHKKEGNIGMRRAYGRAVRCR